MNDVQVNPASSDNGDLSFDAVITLEALAWWQGVAPVADPSALFGDF